MATYNGPPVGSEYTLDSPASGSSGGFFESVTQGIGAFGQLAGIGLSTYSGIKAVKASGRPETTYDQEYVRDIAGQPVAYPGSISAGTLLLFGAAAVGLFLMLRK